MVKTVYINNETISLLSRGLMEQGIKVSETDFEPSELRIELINAPTAITLGRKWNNLLYTIAFRTFPNGVVKDKQFSIPRRVLTYALKKKKEEIQEGKTGINELDSLDQASRGLVIISEIIRCWMKNKNIPDASDGIVLISGDPPQMQVVNGGDRPELTFLKVNPETGQWENHPLRFYGDSDVKSIDDLYAAEEDIVSISKTIVDPESGEEKAIPVFGAEFKATRLMAGLAKEGHQIGIDWNGSIALREGLDHETLGPNMESHASIRLFVSVEDMRKLPDITYKPRMLPEEIRQAFILELTDAPLTSVVNTDHERRDTSFTLYRRIALSMFSQAVARLLHHRYNDRDYLEGGAIEGVGTEAATFTALAVMKTYKKVVGILLAADCIENIRQTANSGIWITLNGENAVLKRVTGSQLPKVASYFGNEFRMVSPQVMSEEESGSEILAELTPEMLMAAEKKLSEKEEQAFSDSTDIELLTHEADKGNAAAMKRLGKLYEEGELIPQDNAKAAELYKKALAITPDDKDLEFDLFMLEMIT